MTGERSWADESSSQVFLKWNAIAELPPSGDQSESLGVAGPFVGVSNDVLIVAGGANFPKPYSGQAKVWHDDIWVLTEWSCGQAVSTEDVAIWVIGPSVANGGWFVDGVAPHFDSVFVDDSGLCPDE